MANNTSPLRLEQLDASAKTHSQKTFNQLHKMLEERDPLEELSDEDLKSDPNSNLDDEEKTNPGINPELTLQFCSETRIIEVECNVPSCMVFRIPLGDELLSLLNKSGMNNLTALLNRLKQFAADEELNLSKETNADTTEIKVIISRRPNVRYSKNLDIESQNFLSRIGEEFCTIYYNFI